MQNDFDLDSGLEVLRRTPVLLRAWLAGLPGGWTHANEGPDTWSPFDIVGHLIHGERTDWIPRAKQVLSGNAHKPFQPFDRFAQFQDSRGKTMEELLDTFARLRAENVKTLEELGLTDRELELRGVHPAFGTVTLRQLLATWVVHDLNHVFQIARVMAFQWKDAAGPWKEYLRILNV